MTFYPVFLDLAGRRVVLVGGGAVAWQKIPALLEAGARIDLVSPEVVPEIEALNKEGRLKWHARPYQKTDIKEARLVIAATDNPDVQKTVACDCRSQGIWVNVVDVPPLCDFIAPAIVRKGPVQVAVSTGGAAPALAKYLRMKLENALDPAYADFAVMVGRYRADILKLPKDRRRALWDKLVNDAFFQNIRDHGIGQAESQLREWLK